MMKGYVMNIAEFPTQDLIKIVSDLLESMLKANNQIPNTQITYFHSRAVPNITVLSYLTRIYRFAPFTNEALLSMLTYFDAIAKLENGFTMNSYNIHRLLITSIVVASKFTSDIFYANSRYAKVGGIPLRELNQLELEFLFLIDFQLHVSLENLQDYADGLLSHAMSLPNPITLQQQHTNIHPYIHHPIQTISSVAPLTPPYTASAIIEQKPSLKRKSASQHPPSTRKKRLGLVSPKED